MRYLPRAAVVVALLVLCTGFEWEGRLSRLRRDLSSPDVGRRREVVRLLASYPTHEVEEALLEALADEDPGVQAEAAEAVARVRLTAALPVLIDWLDDPRADLRTSAARSLGRIGDASVVPNLVRALGDRSTDVRAAALSALAQIGGPAVVVPLLGRLDDAEPEVRRGAADALARVGDERAVVPLVGRARDDTPEVRAAVYRSLGAIGDARAVSALVLGLEDEVEEPRLAAVAALGRLRNERAVDALIARLERPDARQARALVSALGAIGSERALSAVLETLNRQEARETVATVLVEHARRSSTEERRRLTLEVATALGQARSHLHATAHAELLRRLLELGAVPETAEAISTALAAHRGSELALLTALARSGSPDALVPLLERLRANDPATQGAALVALDRYFETQPRDGRAADPLLDALGHVAAVHRIRVVRLLGVVGASRALPALRPLLEHDDPRLRLASVEAIGALGDPEGAPVLFALLDDADPRTRFEASRALGGAAGADTVRLLAARLGDAAAFDRHAGALALGMALARLEPMDALDEATAAAARAALVQLLASEDTELAARALDALTRWGDPAAGVSVAELLTHRVPALRRQAAAALGRFRGEAAASARREALEHSSPRIVAGAASTLGELGTAQDGELLLGLLESGAWPVPAAAAFGLVRLARRGVALPSDAPARLCAAARHRDAYLRANIAVTLAALEAPACPDGPSPMTWLERPHSAPVRAAAARWVVAAAAAGHLEPLDARRALARCAANELADEVGRACREAEMPALDGEADVYAHSSAGSSVLRDHLVALRLADGSVLVTSSDANGHFGLSGAPAGELRLEDPMTTPLEP